MDLLTTLARRILLPPLVVFSFAAVSQLYQGKSLNIYPYLEPLLFLSCALLAVWVPLPFIRKVSSRVAEPWQSPARIFLGVLLAGLSFGVFIYIVISYGLFE